MSKYSAAVTIVLALALGMSLPVSAAQWSPEPGTSVRDDFGPKVGNRANQCRGACGAGCPDSCAKSVSYECAGPARLQRVVTYECGTHQGCRVHDQCLDTCLLDGARGGDCQAQCDADIIDRFGMDAGSWLIGKGPYDGYITYEYTRDDDEAQAPAFRCPEGASLQCGDDSGCVAANGGAVEPVFDSYPGVAADAMRISAFRAGPRCGGGVCEQSTDIRIGGQDVCGGNPCTRFGMEFDYRNADPTKPLECSVSTSGGEQDFIGDLLKLGADAHQTRTQEDSKPAGQEDGMAQLLGMFSKVIASADSPEDLQISMAPLDENGNPDESQRVGSAAASADPPIPRSVDLPSANGHLFVPMYQVADQSVSGAGKERLVRCTHNGVPVLETTFRLRAD